MVIKFTTLIKNDSLQVGDVAYYKTTTSIGSTDFAYNPMRIGKIDDISSDSITINSVSSTPGPNDFIMFSKNKSVNNTSLLGYYAEVKIANNSMEHAELFTLSSEIAPSSK